MPPYSSFGFSTSCSRSRRASCEQRRLGVRPDVGLDIGDQPRPRARARAIDRALGRRRSATRTRGRSAPRRTPSCAAACSGTCWRRRPRALRRRATSAAQSSRPRDDVVDAARGGRRDRCGGLRPSARAPSKVRSRGSQTTVGTPASTKASRSISNSVHVGTLAEVDDRDRRRRCRAAPVAVARRAARREAARSVGGSATAASVAERVHRLAAHRTARRAAACRPGRPATRRCIRRSAASPAAGTRRAARRCWRVRIPGSMRISRSSASVTPSCVEQRARSSIAAATTRSPMRGNRLGTRRGCALRRRRSGRTAAGTDSACDRRTSASAAASRRRATAQNCRRQLALRPEQRRARRATASIRSSTAAGRAGEAGRRTDAEHLLPARPATATDGRSAPDRSTRFAIFSTTCRK